MSALRIDAENRRRASVAGGDLIADLEAAHGNEALGRVDERIERLRLAGTWRADDEGMCLRMLQRLPDVAFFGLDTMNPALTDLSGLEVFGVHFGKVHHFLGALLNLVDALRMLGAPDKALAEPLAPFMTVGQPLELVKGREGQLPALEADLHLLQTTAAPESVACHACTESACRKPNGSGNHACHGHGDAYGGPYSPRDRRPDLPVLAPGDFVSKCVELHKKMARTSRSSRRRRSPQLHVLLKKIFVPRILNPM